MVDTKEKQAKAKGYKKSEETAGLPKGKNWNSSWFFNQNNRN